MRSHTSGWSAFDTARTGLADANGDQSSECFLLLGIMSG